MPDYGDDRGFRSRGVPADIGFDRAGPGRNYNRGYGPGDVTMSDVPFDTRSTFNRDTPVQTGGSRGEFAPPLYSGRNPFIQPIQTGGRQGEFGGMGRQPIYTGFGGEGSRIMGYEDPMSSGSYLSSKFGGGPNPLGKELPPFSPGPFNPEIPEFDMAGGLLVDPDDYPMFPSGPGIRPRLKYDPEVQEIDLLDMMEDETFEPDFNQDEYYSDGWDTADVGDEYRFWNSIRRKYGPDVADRMMGGNVAVNRGGIMGLI